VLARSAGGWVRQATLTPRNAGTDGWFGNSLAIAGDTIAVGSPSEGNGTVYVYVRNNGSWSPQAYLQASNAGADDFFGNSVAIAGDTIVVGAPFEDSSAKDVGGDQNDEGATDSGAAYVFVRNSGNWTQQAYIKASNTGAGDGFGAAVAIYGDTFVISSPEEDSASPGVNGDQSDESASDSGAAYVFVRDGGNWTQQAYLKASNPGGPDALTGQGDGFGGGEALPSRGVAIWGDTIAIGAGGEDSSASGIDGDQSNDIDQRVDTGAVYVFVRGAAGWAQQAYIKASNPQGGAQFGGSVALSGERLAVGAWAGGRRGRRRQRRPERSQRRTRRRRVRVRPRCRGLATALVPQGERPGGRKRLRVERGDLGRYRCGGRARVRIRLPIRVSHATSARSGMP
jgi:hypothetical protein